MKKLTWLAVLLPFTVIVAADMYYAIHAVEQEVVCGLRITKTEYGTAEVGSKDFHIVDSTVWHIETEDDSTVLFHGQKPKKRAEGIDSLPAKTWGTIDWGIDTTWITNAIIDSSYDW